MAAAEKSMPKPLRVSPLIRLGRWTFLALGITYGVMRRQELQALETARREIEEKERPAREAAMAAEKEKLNREEMVYLAKEVGVPVPPGYGGAGEDDSKCLKDN